MKIKHACALALGAAIAPTTWAQAPAPTAAAATAAPELATVTVIGSKEAESNLAGSGTYLDREDLTRQGYDDVHRVLREVPGVYVREEDGYGLFPNISLRGVDPGRSAKVTLMEDGILVAPAPYSDPAAYYSPTAGRMHGLEVLKGSSQVRFGPHSTGGVINYLSTPIPGPRSGYLRSAFGSDSELRNHLWLGETFAPGPSGTFGYVVEVFQRSTDGFKTIDGPVSTVGPDAGKTGFTNFEPMVKLAWEPATALAQRLEFKYGYTDRDADETYPGLNSADFDADPYRRYASSRFDFIETEHERMHLRHIVDFTPETQLVTTAYRSDFHRNWARTIGVGVPNGEGGFRNVDINRALEDPAELEALNVLRGSDDGRLNFRNANREYELQGLEAQLRHAFGTGGIEHELRAGVRLHEDEAFRFQNNETLLQDEDGLITSRVAAAPGSQDNRIAETRALSVHVEDSIKLGRLTLLPGVRYEDLDWDNRNFNTDATSDGDEGYFTAGLGFNWAHSESLNWFGGLFQGFSPPSPAAGAADDPAEEERSLSAELGLRHTAAGGLRTELALFATQFENLLVTGNLGASGDGDGGAVGEVDIVGVEGALRHQFGAASGGWQVPVFLSFTYTQAEIGNDSNTGDDAESIFSGGRDGADLPYVPELQATAGIGLRRGIWSLDMQMQYVDEVYATALNTEERLVQNADGSLVIDARGGRIDSYFVTDLTAAVQVHPRARLFVNVYNLFDEEYETSRLPQGPRPGAPQTAFVGAEIRLF